MPKDLKILLMVLFLAVMAVHLYRNRVVDPYLVKGNGFTMSFPPSWEENDDYAAAGIILASEEEPEVVAFVAPTKNFFTEIPDAIIIIASLQMENSIWIQDDFPIIVQNLAQIYKIADQGEVMIDERLAKWVLLDDQRKEMLILEFYMADFTKVFYKIRFLATYDGFNKYRADFEAAKSTFTFKRKEPPKF